MSEIPEKIELNNIYNIDAIKGMELLPNESIDMIITDPPYKKEFIYLYEKLAKEACRILKSGSYCFAYCGAEFLPQTIQMMNKYLDWFWLFEIKHGNQPRLWYKKLMIACKPVLVFTKGFPKKTEWLCNLQTDTQDKNFHKWGQGIEFPLRMIRTLTSEKEIILDPFLGGGTVACAAKYLNRKYIGFELDKETFIIAKSRISEQFNESSKLGDFM